MQMTCCETNKKEKKIANIIQKTEKAIQEKKETYNNVIECDKILKNGGKK